MWKWSVTQLPLFFAQLAFEIWCALDTALLSSDGPHDKCSASTVAAGSRPGRHGSKSTESLQEIQRAKEHGAQHHADVSNRLQTLWVSGNLQENQCSFFFFFFFKEIHHKGENNGERSHNCFQSRNRGTQNKRIDTRWENGRQDELGDWCWHIHTIMNKILE